MCLVPDPGQVVSPGFCWPTFFADLHARFAPTRVRKLTIWIRKLCVKSLNFVPNIVHPREEGLRLLPPPGVRPVRGLFPRRMQRVQAQEVLQVRGPFRRRRHHGALNTSLLSNCYMNTTNLHQIMRTRPISNSTSTLRGSASFVPRLLFWPHNFMLKQFVARITKDPAKTLKDRDDLFRFICVPIVYFRHQKVESIFYTSKLESKCGRLQCFY